VKLNARPIMFLLLVLVLLVLLVALTSPALAQEGTSPAPGGNLVIPDLGEILHDIQEGLSDFYASTPVLMGLAVYLVTQFAKWALPNTTMQTETIYGAVIVFFTGAYLIAQLIGGGAFLGRAVDIGTLVANTLLAILGMGIVPSVTYNVAQRVNNPVLGGRQGIKKFSLAAPERNPTPQPPPQT